jgi:hypothetical protein
MATVDPEACVDGRARRTYATASLLTLVASTVILASVGDTRAAAADDRWKGAETLNPISVAPNLARCGAFPRNLEARLAGSGVDTNGGPYLVTASGCLDTRANVIFDLEATDTYLRSREALRIAPDDVALDVDPQTCVGASRQPTGFRVAGGTGSYARARGSGSYTLVMTMPGCLGPQSPAHIWFTGSLATEG